jgi:hypothetical protein
VYSDLFGLGIVGLIISCVLQDLSQALMNTYATMFLDRLELIFYFIHTIL